MSVVGKKIILAICYDFDKTLSPDDMQSQGFIQALGYDVQEFWKESNELAERNEMDSNLAYMYMMSVKSKGKVPFTRETLMNAGKGIGFFPGVLSWFDRINAYGREHDVEVQHFIISSGLKEMVEGAAIGDKFRKIYASSFYYDKNGVAVWPSQVVNYTGKTQFLFRIEKGALDVNDRNVNEPLDEEYYAVPFRNMVYIGDSDTDIPCMKLVNSKGGHSIGVFDPKTRDKSKVYKMLEDERIRYYVPADYREGSALDILVKDIIVRTEANEKLEALHNVCIHEMQDNECSKNEEEREKEMLINLLEDSNSFRTTHEVVRRMAKYKEWSNEQKGKLIHIALTNHQVTYILEDGDLRRFYLGISDGCEGDEVRKLRNWIE